MHYDVIVIGSGAAGMTAAITAARASHNVLLLEKLGKVGAKLKATGGGRCNLTNTLDNDAFMARFGREGRFMTPALQAFDHRALIAFFADIGIPTHAPDGFRVFPVTHNAATIVDGLAQEMARLGVEVRCERRVTSLLRDDHRLHGVRCVDEDFYAPNVIVATGGLGYPALGADGDGYAFAEAAGHTITPQHPAMMPLRTKERWVERCRADTMAAVELRVPLPKAKKLRAKGDLIFTKTGIRGPVVLDFAREVTPLLQKYGEVPLLLNLTRGMHEDALFSHLKNGAVKQPDATVLTLVQRLLPEPLSRVMCEQADVDPALRWSALPGVRRAALTGLLAWTPLTVTGHDGFKQAMITRGGVKLSQIDPDTLQSRLLPGLYFCGEVMDLDGPCGGYNLQWAFAGGFLAGQLKRKVG